MHEWIDASPLFVPCQYIFWPRALVDRCISVVCSLSIHLLPSSACSTTALTLCRKESRRRKRGRHIPVLVQFLVSSSPRLRSSRVNLANPCLLDSRSDSTDSSNHDRSKARFRSRVPRFVFFCGFVDVCSVLVVLVCSGAGTHSVVNVRRDSSFSPHVPGK